VELLAGREYLPPRLVELLKTWQQRYMKSIGDKPERGSA
jgi:hypothetical protein